VLLDDGRELPASDQRDEWVLPDEDVTAFAAELRDRGGKDEFIRNWLRRAEGAQGC
jgi:hypothetical protein